MPKGSPVDKGRAHVIAHTLKRRVESMGEFASPRSWILAAESFGMDVYALKGEGVGYYHAGKVFYNRRGDAQTVCRRLCHEIAHGLIAEWADSQSRMALEYYDGGGRQSREHRLACEVEALLFGELS